KARLMSDDATNPFGQVLDLMVELHPEIERAITDGRPDVIILDHFLIPPCVLHGNIPWVLLVSAAPLLLYRSSELPPGMTGQFVKMHGVCVCDHFLTTVHSSVQVFQPTTELIGT